MTGDALFDADAYGEATTKRRSRVTNADEHVEPFTEPWVLLANRHGVLGFHVPKHVDHYSTAHTLCGLQGHVVEPPDQMVRCVDCEIRRTSEV
jgi:hypothetical protein